MPRKTKFFVKFFRVVRNKKVAEHIPESAAMLDVGCGSDFYLLQSVGRKIRTGTGIDIAVRNLKKDNITIRKMKLDDRLPFKSGSFDVVTMIAFIEHLDKPKEMISEVRRVLRNGGRLIITTPMGRARPFWEALVKLGLTEEKTTEDHKHYFTPKEIESLLTKNGFKIIVSENFEAGMNYIAVGQKK
ncbi:MAG: class I SAM-dependent methyltransferase [Candidatus Aenigmarchaeota archaeon]|nr:class I SAM-dependent methyltransferase [Candidatus Aenigmarchaeota archaeon]